jgi:hypothetical protein
MGQKRRGGLLRRTLIVFGVALLYALFCRLIFGWDALRDYAPIVSISFLTLVPMAFGFAGGRIIGGYSRRCW